MQDWSGNSDSICCDWFRVARLTNTLTKEERDKKSPKHASKSAGAQSVRARVCLRARFGRIAGRASCCIIGLELITEVGEYETGDKDWDATLRGVKLRLCSKELRSLRQISSGRLTEALTLPAMCATLASALSGFGSTKGFKQDS